MLDLDEFCSWYRESSASGKPPSLRQGRKRYGLGEAYIRDGYTVAREGIVFDKAKVKSLRGKGKTWTYISREYGLKNPRLLIAWAKKYLPSLFSTERDFSFRLDPTSWELSREVVRSELVFFMSLSPSTAQYLPRLAEWLAVPVAPSKWHKREQLMTIKQCYMEFRTWMTLTDKRK